MNAVTQPPSLFHLFGRTALVTGAARGLGLAIAHSLASHGAEVWICGRDSSALDEAARSMAGQVHTLAFDVGQESETEAAIRSFVAQAGRWDILVNTVGQRRREPLEKLPPQALRDLLETNLVGAWNLCRLAAPIMQAQGRGSIVNITSIAGPIARAGDAAYTTSKGALEAMTRALAAELGPHGVRVNAIAPGYFATETNAAMVTDEAVADWLKRRTSLGRWGQAPEIAGAAVFLASDAASYMTGQVLAVDGGYLAHF